MTAPLALAPSAPMRTPLLSLSPHAILTRTEELDTPALA